MMVCPNDAQVRQQLETLYLRSPSVSIAKKFGEFFQQIGQAIVYELTRDRNEPRISKFYNVEGKALWHIYDPTTRQRYTYDSENDVREWLEQRYSK